MGKSKSDRYVEVKTVADWISKGIHNRRLHELIAQKFDLISYGARNRLIKEAMSELFDDFDRETIRKSIVKQLETVVEKALEADELNSATNALDKTSKLLGLYTEKHEHTVHEKVIEIKFGDSPLHGDTQ